jgi:hypothetical protein
VDSEKEIYYAAAVMMKFYGADADVEAAQRTVESLESGDLECAATWRRILRAIQMMQSGPQEGELVN